MRLNESILCELANSEKISMEDIEKLQNFTYSCYYCGKEVTEDVQELLKTLRGYGYDEQDILGFFNNPEYNLCPECGEES